MLNEWLEIFAKYSDRLLMAFIETFQMMSVSMIFTLVLGILIGFGLFFTRNDGIYENKVLYTVMSTLINIVRSIPFILFVIVMIPVSRAIVGTGFGVKASILPLSLIGIATFGRFMERDLLDVDKNTYETSYALGASTFQYAKNFLMVEARSSLVLSFTSTTISLLAYSTVMGVVGGGGLGYLAMSEGYYNFNYKLMWIIILIFIIIVQIIQSLGNIIAKNLDRR